ncbi:hypothetical protein MMC14_005479 [Varicellaria rhodocarpa]|nr:hypothetical protein [Varicellaria rhodocarpa]
MLFRFALRPSTAGYLKPIRWPSRPFSIFSPVAKKLSLPPRPTVNESDIEEAFLKGSGPGGQKINKTSSAVQLKHIPSGIVVKCQHTRSRPTNRMLARRLLAEKLEVIEKGQESRVEVKRSGLRKKKASATKKKKRKYKSLAGEQEDDEGDEEGDEDVAEAKHEGGAAKDNGDEVSLENQSTS